jgi:hypothetical protein
MAKAEGARVVKVETMARVVKAATMARVVEARVRRVVPAVTAALRVQI